jgi:hypothetical protein
MIPEPDPNKEIEDGLKADGEFLRDVDKGMSSTETGFNIDLGTVRDAAELEHSEVIEEMQQSAEPPAAPEPSVLEVQSGHTETMAELGAIEGEAPASTESPTTSPPKASRPSLQEIETDHGEAFVELGNVIRQQYSPQEQPTEVKVNPAEVERLTFPGGQHSSQVQGSMEGFLAEQRQWNETVTDLFWQIARMNRQMRLELDQIRGYLERSRL